MPNNGDKKKKISFKNIINSNIELAGVDTIKKPIIGVSFKNVIDNFSKKDKPVFKGDFDQLEPVERLEPKESKGFFTQLKEAFTGENLETEETKLLPEIGEAETDNKLKVFGTVFSSIQPEEQANILESNIEGLTQRKDPKGNIIVKFPNGNEAVLNKPGFSMSDFRNMATEAIQFFPASKLASLGKTFLAKIGLGASASGATQAIKEGVQSQIGGEFDTGEVLESTALGSLGEALPAGFKGLKGRRQAKRIGAEKDAISETAESIKQAEDATSATGVELFPAQKTQVPATLEKQSFIATLPSAQRASITALKKQNKQVGDATENFLNSIAKADAIETGAETFRTASQKAIDAQKAIRKEKTSTLFNEAFSDKTPVNINPVKKIISEKISEFPEGGEVSKSIKKINRLISGSPELKRLQNTKLEIDQMISKFGEGSLGNTTKKEIINIKNELLKQMDEVSPKFKEARRLFASESPAIEELEKSIIGKISKIDDAQLKSVSKKIFDPEQTNVSSILKTKKIIDDIDPEAWNGLLRSELERRLGSIKSGLRETAGETVENIPAQLNRAIFGNQKQTNILLNSVSKEQAKNLRYLQTALKRAGSGRLGGSQTATREEIKSELRGGFLNLLGKIFTPLESAKGGLTGATFDKNVKKLSEALFDTKWQPQLSKIRKINPNTPEAARLWTQLLNNIENENEVK